MKNYIKIIACYIFFICFCGCIKNNISLSYCVTPKTSNSDICLVLENTSKVSYIYYIPSSVDEDGWNYYIGTKHIIRDEIGQEPKVNSVYIDRLFPNEKEMNEFLLNEKKDSLLWKEFQSRGINVDFFWTKSYKKMQKDKFILSPNEQHTFTKKNIFSIKQLNSSGSYYKFNLKKRYTIQTEIIFDSTRIKKHLLKKDLDSLKNNGIKIFHGKLITEKVPLIID